MFIICWYDLYISSSERVMSNEAKLNLSCSCLNDMRSKGRLSL